MENNDYLKCCVKLKSTNTQRPQTHVLTLYDINMIGKDHLCLTNAKTQITFLAMNKIHTDNIVPSYNQKKKKINKNRIQIFTLHIILMYIQ